MGIETSLPDVEESTEPPICPYQKESKSQPNDHPSDVKPDPQTENRTQEQNPTPLKSTSNNPTRQDDLRGLLQYPHTVEPEQLAVLLDVDAR